MSTEDNEDPRVAKTPSPPPVAENSTRESHAREMRRLRGYLSKFEGLRATVEKLVNSDMTGMQLRKALLDALNAMGGANRPDIEALISAPALENKSALVLYFKNDADREDFARSMEEAARQQGWDEVRTRNLN